MAYVINVFDGLQLPIEIRSGDRQDMGTGKAMSSFVQLAGGGFYDNYGDNPSPREVSPVSKRCLLIADTNPELTDKLDALRAKIGVRGRLTAQFDDGSLRWIWARLVGIATPRPSEAKRLWLPCELTFTTSDQSWQGTIWSGTAWTWGDDTWTWGDGTVVFGQDAQSFTLNADPLTLTLNNGGNINATNLVISITPTFTMSSVLVGNILVPSKLINFGDSVSSGEELIIDCGARSITVDGVDAYSGVSSISDKAAWIPLYPGDNSITVNPTVGSGSLGGTVTCSWHDTWA